MLRDKYNRTLELIEIAASDSCQYSCPSCGALGSPPSHNLFENENIIRFMGAMSALGLRKARIIGGEPLMRPDIVELLSGLTAIKPKIKLSMATNGRALPYMVDKLKSCGLDRLFVSVPTLDPVVFKAITDSDNVSAVINGVIAAMEADIPLAIRYTLKPGVNDQSMPDVVDWAVNLGLDIYIVEELGEKGLPLTEEQILSGITAYELNDISKPGARIHKWRVEGHNSFIKVVTYNYTHSCIDCNRLWLSAHGILHPCASSSKKLDLRGFFEEDPTENELIEFASKIPFNKPWGIYDKEDLAKTAF